ncbi:GGDEF domain-containing protein [Alcaligenaceae bacterium]|nr:GGDEF domain-containing protein [Alcaligenaceae bacterium]
MVDTDLFEAEMAALTRAQTVMTATDLDAGQYRQALEDLVQHYRRLMRETHRLIRHGDRSEAELNAVNTRLQQLSAELDYKARHDSLTGTLNRRAIFEEAQGHLREAPLALIILDIDFFKRINDTYGHPAGDAVLKELVERLFGTLGGRGNVGRVGGEEFTILLPGTELREAVSTAESIRLGIAGQAFSSLPSHQVTASFGVSWNERHTDFALAYSSTDAALYRAKNQGRNQVAF